MSTSHGLTASVIRREGPRVLIRVDRLIHGNAGLHRNLTGGVCELKIDVGPGYRVYYSIREKRLLLLLAGGSKATQNKDIKKALEINRLFEGATSMTQTQSPTNPDSVKLSRYDVSDHLRSQKEMAAYLDASLSEFPDDVSGIARAVGDIARAKGMTQVAKDAGLSRESLYCALG